MPDSLTSETQSEFICACEESMRSACEGEPFYEEHEGKRYCVLHFPSKEKSADFEKALQRKLNIKDFNLNGVWFPDKLSFAGLEFGAETYFRGVTFVEDVDFTEVTFRKDADFSGANFLAAAIFYHTCFHAKAYLGNITFHSKADFSYSIFEGDASLLDTTFNSYAVFNDANFRGGAYLAVTNFRGFSNFAGTSFIAEADFGGATFSAEADFSRSTFLGEASFRGAVFYEEANLSETYFGDHLWFVRTLFRLASPSLNLQFSKIDKPDRVVFHSVTLRPYWFVNVDSRRFQFTNVNWDFTDLTSEVRSLQAELVASQHRVLATAYRNLAISAEENHRYEEASKFRYMAMDARRLETWRGFSPWRLSWWYWLASGYGERVSQAFFVLLGIWFVAGLLYTQVGFARWEPKLASEADIAAAKLDDIGAPLKLSRALTYSAAVMTFQKPEPRPATTAAQTVVLLETILGPVQAALLALAIRRKFMR